MPVHWTRQLRIKLAAYEEIISLLTQQETEELIKRKRNGPITGIDATVLNILEGRLNSIRLSKNP